MKKQIQFEGYLFQDISTARKPIYLLRDEDTKKAPTLEKLLAGADVASTVTTIEHQMWMKEKVDFVDDTETRKRFSEISKSFVREHLKKVRVTVIVEDVDDVPTGYQEFKETR